MDNYFLHAAVNGWRPAVEILVLWFVIYHILLFFEGTRALQVLRGIVLLLVAFFLSQHFGLVILEWLLRTLFGISVTAILIIFHPEIRQGLARLGQQHLFKIAPLRAEELEPLLTLIAEACENLAKRSVGALIVIENRDSLNAFVKTGVTVDAKLSSDLIETVFTPNSLLHDGALIVQNGRIGAAGCILPLTQNQELSRMYGTRHRAALGLSEETDAVILIVSEERKDISLVHRETLYKDIEKQELVARTKNFLTQQGGAE